MKDPPSLARRAFEKPVEPEFERTPVRWPGFLGSLRRCESQPLDTSWCNVWCIITLFRRRRGAAVQSSGAWHRIRFVACYGELRRMATSGTPPYRASTTPVGAETRRACSGTRHGPSSGVTRGRLGHDMLPRGVEARKRRKDRGEDGENAALPRHCKGSDRPPHARSDGVGKLEGRTRALEKARRSTRGFCDPDSRYSVVRRPLRRSRSPLARASYFGCLVFPCSVSPRDS